MFRFSFGSPGRFIRGRSPGKESHSSRNSQCERSSESCLHRLYKAFHILNVDSCPFATRTPIGVICRVYRVLSLGLLRVRRGVLLGSLIRAVLYHGSSVLARHEVVRPFKRFGGFRFVPLCLLVSPIFAGFLSVLLSTLLSAFSSCLFNCGLLGLQMACHCRAYVSWGFTSMSIGNR